jgi:hypothetical protein
MASPAPHTPPNSHFDPSPFPNPVQPEQPPFNVIPPPPHISNELWQTSYYDATSDATMGVYVQLPDGPCHLETGKLVDGEFQSPGPWKQV